MDSNIKNTYVISGVAGMTGSLVAKRLLDQGHQVIGFDNYFAGSPEDVKELNSYPGFTFFESDINDAEAMEKLFSDCKAGIDTGIPHIFINCAAVVHTKYFYQVESTFATNVLAMRDTLDRSICAGFSIYINCSTSEVYSMNSWEEGGVREDHPILLATAEQSLRTSYATGKLLTEHFMRDRVEKGDIKGCSIRFANVYSPTEAHDEHIIPHIIASLQKTGGVTLLEHAKETRRTFLHNSDSCDAVLALVATESALDGSVYNVGTEEEISIVDLVKKIAKLLNIVEANIKFEGTRSADPRRRLLNLEKIRERTGWSPTVNLEEGLRQCIANRTKGGHA